MPRIEMILFDGGRTARGAGFMRAQGSAQPNMECSFNGLIPVDAGEILKIPVELRRIDLIWINVAATEIQ
jgi:hypothetical protein